MRWAGIVLVLAAGAAAQELKPVPAAPAATLASGTYEATSPGKRPYLYRVPDKGPRPPCLILMLHGTGMKYGWPFWNYPIHTGHFRPFDFVVAPESDDPDKGFLQGKADRDEVASLIKLFRKTWPEIRRVYLYGHSQGAFFCYYFAGEEPEMLDGIVAHAGNFFKAKLDKTARDRVAIGILHGRADAVVTVQCAFTTFLTYREGGYANVKLMVVDGLNEQSGHWPLPWHVPRMLAWCDRVSAKGPLDAAEAALEELAQEEPDLGAVGQAATLGRSLVEKAAPDEARAASERLGAVEALLDKARESFAKSLLPRAEAESQANGPWATELRIADRAFGPRWREGEAGLQKPVARDTKAIDDARKTLAKGAKKSYGKALDTGRKAFLGAGYEDLLLELGRWDKPGDAISLEDLQAYRAAEPGWKKALDDGRKAAADLWAPDLKAFRDAHADWLAPYKTGD
jgi:pimeloyl-ACP methyl ester carboxylesterase